MGLCTWKVVAVSLEVWPPGSQWSPGSLAGQEAAGALTNVCRGKVFLADFVFCVACPPPLTLPLMLQNLTVFGTWRLLELCTNTPRDEGGQAAWPSEPEKQNYLLRSFAAYPGVMRNKHSEVRHLLPMCLRHAVSFSAPQPFICKRMGEPSDLWVPYCSFRMTPWNQVSFPRVHC